MNEFNVPGDIRKLSRERAPEFHKLLQVPPTSQIEVGQIWSTRADLDLTSDLRFTTNEARLVVILTSVTKNTHPLDQVTTAPISLQMGMATDFDVLVMGDQSPLGFDFMVEVWNETPVLVTHFKQYLGILPEHLVTVLRTVYRMQVLDEELPIKLRKWVGLRVIDESDPRLAFQEAEIEAVEYLAQAATAAIELEAAGTELTYIAPLPRVPRILELQPVRRKLSDLIRTRRMGYASGGMEEQQTYVVHHQTDREELVIEIINGLRPPYPVYLKVHNLSPSFEGRACTVTIISTDGEMRSQDARLELDADIIVGNDPDFRRNQIKTVKLEIE